MILFDYGQTLVNEEKFDGVKGTAEELRYASVNKYNRTAEEIQSRCVKVYCTIWSGSLRDDARP